MSAPLQAKLSGPSRSGEPRGAARPDATPRRRWARLAAPTLAGAFALLLGGCDLFDAVKRRLAVLGVDFEFAGLDVGRLVYPDNWLTIGGDLITRDRSSLRKYGVDIRCALRAENPNGERAVFDGALARLRVRDTTLSDPDVSTRLPAFTVGAQRETTLTVTFPLRLDAPVFSLDVWRDIVRGEDIPYRLDADLAFALVAPTGYGVLDTLATRTFPLTVARSSVNVRETSGPVLRRFLEVLDWAF